MKIIAILILFLIGAVLVYLNSSKKEDKIISNKIECPSGTAGEYCQYSDNDNCNGRGKVIIDFEGKPLCQCFKNFDGENCENCKIGYGGNNCEFSDEEHCKGRGTVKSNNDKKPVCINCIPPFDGSNCEKCQPGYGGKDCNVNDSFCSDDQGVLRGKIKTDQIGNPQCKCQPGYFGKKYNSDVGMIIKSCHLTTSGRCNNRGYYDQTIGVCTDCVDGYRGDFCEIDERENVA